MRIVPCTIREAKHFVREHHRHARPPTGAVLAIGLEYDGQLIGVGMLGRPTSRHLDADRFTAEATRVCVIEGAPKGASSKLASRLKRIWQLQGGIWFKTYNLVEESGASLRGAGAQIDREVKRRRWSCPSRPREPNDLEGQNKLRWDFGQLDEVPA